jgi:hypothetical protein
LVLDSDAGLQVAWYNTVGAAEAAEEVQRRWEALLLFLWSWVSLSIMKTFRKKLSLFFSNEAVLP